MGIIDYLYMGIIGVFSLWYHIWRKIDYEDTERKYRAV